MPRASFGKRHSRVYHSQCTPHVSSAHGHCEARVKTNTTSPSSPIGDRLSAMGRRLQLGCLAGLFVGCCGMVIASRSGDSVGVFGGLVMPAMAVDGAFRTYRDLRVWAPWRPADAVSGRSPAHAWLGNFDGVKHFRAPASGPCQFSACH
jgi:hypothetical protein